MTTRATFEKRAVSFDAALEIARAALEAGRAKNPGIAVAVVDDSGIPLVVLRTDTGTEQFVTGAIAKAWTAVNFRSSTREIFESIQSGKEDNSQLPFADKSLFLMGGAPLRDGDVVIGGIGAAGAPSGIDDDAIARAGVQAFAAIVKAKR
jgi:uncharacterized protein GlcG (DUF336 family)